MDAEAGSVIQTVHMEEVRYGQLVINKRKKSVTMTISNPAVTAAVPIDTTAALENPTWVKLTARELQVLLLLLENKDRILGREELLKEAWGYGFYGKSRAVDNLIRRLREKIERNPENPRYIMTKWGHGYYFDSRTLKESLDEDAEVAE